VKYRGRLALLAGISGVCAVVLSLILAPLFVVVLRDVLHVGCDLSSDGDGRSAAWVCPDGIGYAVPGLVFAAAIAAIGFTVSVVFMTRRMMRQGSGPGLRHAVAWDLGRFGAVPLVLQTPVSAYVAFTSTYSSHAFSLGVLVGVAGLLPFLIAPARSGRHAAACLAATVAALLATGAASLLAPFIMGCAGLLLCAATVSVLGLLEDRRTEPDAEIDA
jgi:hypothetical protein